MCRDTPFQKMSSKELLTYKCMIYQVLPKYRLIFDCRFIINVISHVLDLISALGVDLRSLRPEVNSPEGVR